MKKFMRIFMTVLMLALLIGVVSGCNKKKVGEYEKYFNNFSSATEYTSAYSTVNLSENVSVYSYDTENDVFITKQTVNNIYGSTENEVITLLGFASKDKEYCLPKYATVLQIKGDYAVVTKPAIGTDTSGEEPKTAMIYKVGVIQFRNTPDGNTRDLTDFSADYYSNYSQFSFVGDYIVTPGLKEQPYYVHIFSTFYDYSQGKLLEKFRVLCDCNYTFSINEGYLVAVGKVEAKFFSLDSLQLNGYLELDERDYYYGFPEDAKGEYAEYISLDIFYLGNGWYSRTAKLKSEEIFEGYNIIYDDYDTYTGETTRYYARVRSDLYNVKTKVTTQKEWLLVQGVANKYNADYYTELCNYLGNISPYDSDTGRYTYALPYLNPARSIKDGYSIMYYYYLPYVEDNNYLAEISFCLMNEQAEIIRIEDLLMPPAYVDGNGVPTSDPMYENYYGSCCYYDFNMKQTVLAEYVGGKYTYSTYVCHDGGVVTAEMDMTDKTGFYGIIGIDGKQLVPFLYDELSPFFGVYCIGMRKVDGKEKIFRIDRNANETELVDVVNIRQGIYIYNNDGKLGLKNYSGNVLIEAKYDTLDVTQIVMENGEYLKSYVVVGDGQRTSIFVLE